MKECTKCKKVKSLSEFGKAYAKAFGDNPARKSQCKECVNAYMREYNKQHNYISANKGKFKNIPKEDRATMSAVRRRLNEAKVRIRKFNKIPTDLTDIYLLRLFKKQEGKCMYTDTVMSILPKQHTSLSLDQIEPDKGYVQGNVQWVCWAVNRAKGDLSEKKFLHMCKAIVRKCND